MKKSKKAFEASTLVLFIVLVATTLALSGTVYMYTKLATQDVRKRACEWDIVKASLSKQVPAAGKFLTRGHRTTTLDNCRRDKLGDLIIRYDDIVENGIINQDKAHRIIADEMAECWKMVGEGKIDPFSNWGNDDTSHCMICTTIKFDKKLRDYYVDSLSNEKLAKERKENGVILHPIPWMIEKDYKKGESYYEFIYDSKPQFSEEELNEMNKQFVTEDTAIIVKLYKFKDKDVAATIMSYGAIIVGAVMIAIGLVLTLTGIGAFVGIPLKILGGIMVSGVLVSLAGTTVLTGVAVFDPVNANPFSACEECNGVGSIKLMPPQFEMSAEIKIDYGEVKGQHVVEEGPYCSIITN